MRTIQFPGMQHEARAHAVISRARELLESGKIAERLVVLPDMVVDHPQRCIDSIEGTIKSYGYASAISRACLNVLERIVSAAESQDRQIAPVAAKANTDRFRFGKSSVENQPVETVKGMKPLKDGPFTPQDKPGRKSPPTPKAKTDKPSIEAPGGQASLF